MQSFLNRSRLLLLLILALAILLRLPHLSGSFWLDEAAQALESTRPLSQQLDIVADFQPPLLHLITHVASYASHTEWWLRTAGALVPGLLTIAILYLFLERAANKKTATIAAALLATSSLHIYFSQELRPYSLPTLFAVASWWALYEQRWRWFTTLTIAGLYSSYLYPFLLIAQTIWLLLNTKKYKQLVVSLVISTACFIPWLPTFFAQLQAGQLLRNELPGWESTVSISQEKALQLVMGKFIFGLSDLSFSLPYLATGSFVVLSLISLLLFSWQKKVKRQQKVLMLLLFWAGAPLAFAWLASWFVPVVEPKRLLLSLAGFYGLASYLFVLSLPQKNAIAKKLATLLIAMLFIINISSTIRYFIDKSFQREDWRGIIRKIEQTYPAQNTIAVFIFPEAFAPWLWYASPDITTISTKAIYVDNTTPLRDLLEPTLDYDYILMFDYLQDLTDPNRLVAAELQKFGFEETGSFSAPNVGFARIFSKQNTAVDQG
ncbi:MAG: hypothetical protein GW946_00935 [Candidatus Pacebacteria bacterium]|nr:hypothetical protein [Candidatus Paceibacterota bacterium]